MCWIIGSLDLLGKEQVSRVEAEARDEERLKVGKAEDVAWLNPNPKPNGVMKVIPGSKYYAIYYV